MAERGRPGGKLFLATVLVAALLVLIALDEEHTFEWLLARGLGLGMVAWGWCFFLWAQGRDWWNEFFTWGVLGEAGVLLIERSFLGWLPLLWPVLWLSGPALSLCFAGGVRELTKDQGWPEQKALGIAIGGGLVLHYVIVGGLVAAVFTLLGGSYP